MPRISLFLFWLFFAFQLPCFAQEYIPQVQQYGVEQGMPHHVVRAILQDRRGFIWVGTDQGLSRFDGYRFDSWTKADNGLQFSRIDDIFEDPNGLFWLFYYRENDSRHDLLGIDLFDPGTGIAVPYERYFAGKLPAGLPRLSSRYAAGKDGTLYLGTQTPAGLLSYHPAQGFRFQALAGGAAGAFIPGIALPDGTVCGMLHPKANNKAHWRGVVAGFATGAILRDLGEFVFTRSSSQQRYSKDGYFLGDIFLGNGVYSMRRWHMSGTSEELYQESRGHYEARPVRTWLQQGRLLVRENRICHAATQEVVLDLPGKFPDLNRNGVYAWLEDGHGRLWLGTAIGLLVVDIQPNRFRRLLFNGDPASLGYAIRGILPRNDGSLLVNTEINGQLVVAHPDRQPRLLHSGYFVGILETGDQTVYTGSSYGVVMRTLPGKPTQQLLWPTDVVWCFNALPNGHLWAGTNDLGVVQMDPARNQAVPVALNGFQELGTASVYYIHQQRDGTRWLCTSAGLYKAAPGAGILARYWSGGKQLFYLPNDIFLHLHIDAEGVFWLATYGGGLIRWNPETGETLRYGRKSGFPLETLYAVYEDNHAHLWMPSDFGIVQFDKVRGEVRRIYTPEEGISHREFNRIAHARGADGTLYFGGLNGITAFQPDDFYQAEQVRPASLEIVECQKFDGNADQMVRVTADLTRNAALVLGPDDRYVELDVALLSYTNTANIQYAWKMDNEPVWHYQRDRTLRFGGLSYGVHTLYIRAQGANGLWASRELRISLVQLAPVYLRWWFIVLMLGTVGAGVVAFVRWRTLLLRARQRELEAEVARATAHIAGQATELRQLNSFKSRFFANISHELRTPLTLILGPQASLLKRLPPESDDHKQLETAQEHTRQLLNLVNEILDLSKMEAGKMEVRETTVSLQPFLHRVVSAFESHAERLGIRFVLEYRIAGRLRVLLDEDKVAKVLNNLLANALKFTPEGGQVTVTAEAHADSIAIRVADTGRGILPEDLPFIFDRFFQSKHPDAASDGGTGIGLSLCREFAGLLGGSVTAESTPGMGSTFTFSFPRREVLGAGTEEPEETPAASLAFAGPLPEHAGILVVEDNPSLRAYVAQILSPMGQVFAMEHGQAALDWLAATPALPAIILSDVMMPVMDGFRLLEALKQDDRYRHIPVVMLTARADMQDKLRALRIGVDDYLLKPFEEEELLARIANLLRNQQARNAGPLGEAAPSTANAPLLSAQDQQWLESLEAVVLAGLADAAFGTADIADQLAMSRSTLIRQTQKLTGLTPAQYLDEARFRQARTLLETRAVQSVKAAAYEVGFTQVENFSRNFRQRFGRYPSEYLG